jgi:hypothetical protein
MPATVTLRDLLSLFICKRFDDRKKKDERKEIDKLAVVSEIFYKFTFKWQTNCSLSGYVAVKQTVDAFR